MPTTTHLTDPDAITVQFGPGAELRLAPAQARQLHRDLGAALDGHEDGTDPYGLVLGDEHPAWTQHSGGTGHDEPEWTDADLQLAEVFYARLRNKAKLFFDTLLDHPGRQLSVDDLVALTAGSLENQFSVAGAINGMAKARADAGRRYPFRWWRGTPARYGVKPSVAALFREARATVAARDVRS